MCEVVVGHEEWGAVWDCGKLGSTGTRLSLFVYLYDL